MVLRPTSDRRHGMSLLEVLVALAIFLFALIVIGKLVILGGERAVDVQQEGQAALLCQAKMAEVVAGAVTLSSQSDVPFDEDPDWTWSVDAEQQSNITGLWTVTVTVSRQRSDGTTVQSSMTQMVLDPSMRGSTMDAAASATSQSTDSGATDSGSGTTSGSGSSAGSGASAMPAAAPAAAPASKSAAPASSTPANSKAATSKGGKS